jgi:glutaconate CoA-transferase subunit B
MGFDEETKRMRLEALYPGVEVADVLENTGFAPILPDNIGVTEPPTDEELRILNDIDPDGMYLN